METLSLEERQRFYQFSLEIADATKSLILNLWSSGIFGEELKEDKTPVTTVDLKAEALAREMISKRFPSHGVVGEEYEPINPESEFQWTIDPIDGTQNLVNRIPTFGTLIGLRYRGEAIVGVIDHPVLTLRTSGGIGLGVAHNKTQIALPDLSEEQLSPYDLVLTNDLSVFSETEEGKTLFHKTLSFHPHFRIYYDCYAQTLALLGSAAVVVEPNLKIWDYTPLEAMLNELGGDFIKFNERGSFGKKQLVHSIFGKRKAVKLMCAHLEI